ncbi:MAG: hypothetical protein LBR89_03875, partial [Holosporales bacterium]|nr:hypothetical protein [Holosporales bacterium]
AECFDNDGNRVQPDVDYNGYNVKLDELARSNKYIPAYDYWGRDFLRVINFSNEQYLAVRSIKYFEQCMSLQTIVLILVRALPNVISNIENKEYTEEYIETHPAPGEDVWETIYIIKTMLRRFIKLGGYRPACSSVQQLIQYPFLRGAEIDASAIRVLHAVHDELYADYIRPGYCSTYSI